MALTPVLSAASATKADAPPLWMIVVLFVFAVVTTVLASKVWRGQPLSKRQPRRWVEGGQPFTEAMPVAVFGLDVLVVISVLIFASSHTSGFLNDLLSGLAIALCGVFLVGFIFFMTIFYFRWPHLLMPPQFRYKMRDRESRGPEG